MFIASKYEEMYAPEVGDFVYITDNTYSKQDIFKMERTMLRKLDFNLSKPLPLHFLRRNSKAGYVSIYLVFPICNKFSGCPKKLFTILFLTFFFQPETFYCVKFFTNLLSCSIVFILLLSVQNFLF